MKTKRLRSRENVIYFLPNFFTTLNLFCGFYAIIASLQDFYVRAALAIMVAGIFDILDGRIARLTKAHSKFGEELDSLADLISFGLAPAILLYMWSLEPFGRIGWLACFVFMACGALRLARFNTQNPTSEKRYFKGLPIPMAAYTVATSTLLFFELMLPENKNYFTLVLTLLLAFLMVSNIKYRSFKDLDFKDKRSFRILVTVVFLIMIIAYNPGIMMFTVMMTYVVSGPILSLFAKRHPSHKRMKAKDSPQLSLVEQEQPNE